MIAKKRDIVIAGYSETAIDFKTGRSAYDLGGEALAKLLAATGISKDAIDGLSVTTPLSECPNPFFAVYMTEAPRHYADLAQLRRHGRMFGDGRRCPRRLRHSRRPLRGRCRPVG